MDHIHRVLQAHPNQIQLDVEVLSDCIKACFECAQSCLVCTDILLGERRDEVLNSCIRLCLNSAEDCEVTGRLLLQQVFPDWGVLRKQLESCIAACRSCGDACGEHKDELDICGVCAESCRECERTCQNLLDIIPSQKKIVKVSVP